MPSSRQTRKKIESNLEKTFLHGVAYSASKKESVIPNPTRDEKTALSIAAEEISGNNPENTPFNHPSTLRQTLIKQVERQPNNPTLWILLGWSSSDARNAAKYFRRALEIDPENPVAQDGLDWALSEIGSIQPWVSGAEEPAGGLARTGIEEISPPLEQVEIPENIAEEETASRRKHRLGIRDFRWRTITRFFYIPLFRNLSIAILYLLLISTAEVITVLVDPIFGIVFHASIMLGLIVHGSIIQQGPFRRYLIVLSLAPLIRLLSLSLPLALFDIPIIYRYMIVGVPLLLAVYFSARSVGLTANRLYFSWKGWPYQILFSLIGLILGTCEFFILRPEALVSSTSWFNIAMGVFILFVFTGFLEELIFRSLLQVTGVQLFGGIAIWIVSILFGVLHIGYYSVFDVVFATSVGLLFGYFALKTRSLLGVSLAHGFTNVTLYILLPLMLGSS